MVDIECIKFLGHCDEIFLSTQTETKAIEEKRSGYSRLSTIDTRLITVLPFSVFSVLRALKAFCPGFGSGFEP